MESTPDRFPRAAPGSRPIGLFDPTAFETPEELDAFVPARIRLFLEDEREEAHHAE